jgi:AcrR family transcriptional regulator
MGGCTVPKQVRAEVTRASILRGAAEVFDRYGYAATTLSDVIAQSGVTKGALYFHFSSKEDLAKAVVEQQHTLSVQPSREWLQHEGQGLESIIRLSVGLATQLLDDVVVRAGIRLTLEQGTFGVLQADPYREWVSVIEELLDRAIEEGDVRTTMESEALARFVVGAFTGVQLLSEVFTNRADLLRRVQDMWDILLPSLVSPRKLAHFRRIASLADSSNNTNGG